MHWYDQPTLAGVIDWYRGCVVCDETLENIRRDLAPMGLTARFDGDIVVVYAKPRIKPEKPHAACQGKVQGNHQQEHLCGDSRREAARPGGGDRLSRGRQGSAQQAGQGWEAR